MVHVIAVIPPSRHAQRRLGSFPRQRAAVKAEAGCTSTARRSISRTVRLPEKNGEDTFVAIEKWESLAALKAHAAGPTWRVRSQDQGNDREPQIYSVPA